MSAADTGERVCRLGTTQDTPLHISGQFPGARVCVYGCWTAHNPRGLTGRQPSYKFYSLLILVSGKCYNYYSFTGTHGRQLYLQIHLSNVSLILKLILDKKVVLL